MVTLASGIACLTPTMLVQDQSSHYSIVVQVHTLTADLLATQTEWLVWPAIHHMEVSVYTSVRDYM